MKFGGKLGQRRRMVNRIAVGKGGNGEFDSGLVQSFILTLLRKKLDKDISAEPIYCKNVRANHYAVKSQIFVS